jgi:hypothetical protein
MRARCSDPDHREYARFGGRGVGLSDEWADFERFYEWSRATGAKRGMCLARLDRDGDYAPENCTWRTREEVSRGARAPRKKVGPHWTVSAFGEAKGPTAWERDPRCSVTHTTVANRLRAGWPAEEAIADPPQHAGSRGFVWRPIRAFGRVDGPTGWERDPRCKVSSTTLLRRLARGWTAEDAIALPPFARPGERSLRRR